MTYTIKQVSEMMSLPVSTIRYYDKMGLIPFLEKNESGYRIFKEKDISMLRIIVVLRQEKVPVKLRFIY